ncbi:MAG: hypothetical protein ABW167_01715 [Baekduia sp.]
MLNAVIRHGEGKVPTEVIVQPTLPPVSPWQFAKVPLVIVATKAVSTETLNVEEVQDAPPLINVMDHPRLPESIRPSTVPPGDQLAADDTDGNTNAHNASTTPKSNMIFFKTIFNISDHSS